MPSWKDNLLDASFRGIEFVVQAHETTFGRRAVKHEFPNKNLPFGEDIGGVGPEFRIEGFVLGDDYFEKKNALINACNQEGPGDLVHPYFGLKRVQCGGASIKESIDDGRIATFIITLIEIDTDIFPIETVDLEADLNAKILAALDEELVFFVRDFSVIDEPGFMLDDAISKIESTANAINAATEPIRVIADVAAELAFTTKNLIDFADDLVGVAAELAEDVQTSISFLSSITDSKLDSLTAYGELFSYGDDFEDIPTGTDTRTKQQKNSDAQANLVQSTAILRSAEMSIGAPFVSIEDAQAKTDEILAKLDAIMLITTSDELYEALQDVSAALSKIVPSNRSELPFVKELTTRSKTNSINFMYSNFESLENEQDMIERNNLENPGFIGGGEVLEVLSE